MRDEDERILDTRRTTSEESKDKQKYPFQKLTPFDDADISAYKEAIDYALENEDVNNIALSGAYGSGKSSIIETYKKDSYKIFIHISLARFGDEENIKEPLLEMKIFNQLLYQVASKKIRQLNLPLKKEIKPCCIWQTAIAVMCCLLAILYFKYIDSILVRCNETIHLWKEALKEEKQVIEAVQLTGIKSIVEAWYNFIAQYDFILRMGLGVLLISITLFFLYRLIREFQEKGLLKRLKFQDAVIELDYTKDENSFFDSYLNEVLYLFENCDADVIVFEDIDRFEKIRVFERLREINTLVNKKRKKEEQLKFFYLVKDDIFSSKDRTKFFDFIIPVVPYISRSNSNKYIKEYLKKIGSVETMEHRFHDGKNLVSEKLIENISLFVDDMRFLKNICNEYYIYAQRLNEELVTADKLFAMTVYKNLFPEDYNNTLLGRGFVSKVIEKILAEHSDKNWGKIVEDAVVESKFDEYIKEYHEMAKSPYINALRYMLIHGCIDDTYQSYMAYIYKRKYGLSPRIENIYSRILSSDDKLSSEEIIECYHDLVGDIDKQCTIIKEILTYKENDGELTYDAKRIDI